MINIINISIFPFTKYCSNMIMNLMNDLGTNVCFYKSLKKGNQFTGSL